MFAFVFLFIAIVWIFILGLFAVIMKNQQTKMSQRDAEADEIVHQKLWSKYAVEHDDRNVPARESTSGTYHMLQEHGDTYYSSEGAPPADSHIVRPSFETGHAHTESSITYNEKRRPQNASSAKKSGVQKKNVKEPAPAAVQPAKAVQSARPRSRYRDAIVYGEVMSPKYF